MDKTNQSKPTKASSSRHVLKTFLENSSVKGVPKLIKSRTACQRSMWIACLVIGNGIGIFFLVFLFVQYLNYETSITTREVYDTQTFPDISICNLNPISTKLPVSQTYERFQLYQVLYGDPLLFPEGRNPTNLSYQQDQYINHVYSVKGYFQNILASEDERLKTTLHDFISNCTWEPWKFNGYTTLSECHTHAKYFYSHSYGPCYTLSLQATDYARAMSQFSAILYVQDRGENHILDNSRDMRKNFASGVRVLIHPRGTLPDMQQAITASPGHESTFHVQENIRRRLGPPYGICYKDKTLPMAPSYM